MNIEPGAPGTLRADIRKRVRLIRAAEPAFAELRADEEINPVCPCCPVARSVGCGLKPLLGTLKPLRGFPESQPKASWQYRTILSSEALAQDVEAQEGFYDLSKGLSPQRSSTTEIFDALHSNGAGVL